MDCERIRELLLSYIDNEIGDDERKLVQVHLAGCRECVAEIEALAVTGSKLRQAYETVAAGASPSPAVWQGIRRRVEVKQQTNKAAEDSSASKWGWLLNWRHPVWRTAVAGAAMLSFMIVFAISIAPVTLPIWTATEQRAIDIATNDPSVQALLDGQGIVYEVVPVNGDMNTGLYQVGLAPAEEVNARSYGDSTNFDSDSISIPEDSESFGLSAITLCGDLSGTWGAAIVDVGNNEVVQSHSIAVDEVGDCLSTEQVQEATQIVQADSRVGTEALVRNVSLFNSYDAESGEFRDEMVVWVRLIIDGEIYLAQVDLDQQSLFKLFTGGE